MKWNEKLKELASPDKRIKLFIIIGAAAVVLLFLSGYFPDNDKGTEDVICTENLNEYEEYLETELTDILVKIEGIGNVSVFITLDSSSENKYIADEDSSYKKDGESTDSDINKKYVITDDTKSALLEKEIRPKIRGVIVICEGADNIAVKQAVINSVTAGLGVSTAKVSVSKGGTTGE